MNNIKNCEICWSVFEKKYNESKKVWAKKRFCSMSCAGKDPAKVEAIRLARIRNFASGKSVIWNKGKVGVYSKKHLKHLSKKMSIIGKKLGFGKWMKGRKGKLNGAWKGDQVGYTALHDWVKAELGTPKKCVHCGISSNNPWKIHWANISNEYKRDLKDWIRLCAKCHKDFDKGRKQTKFLRKR